MRSFNILVTAENMVTVEARTEDEAIDRAIEFFQKDSSYDTVHGEVISSEEIE